MRKRIFPCMRNTWNKAVYKEIQVMDMEQIIREKLVEIEKH